MEYHLTISALSPIYYTECGHCKHLGTPCAPCTPLASEFRTFRHVELVFSYLGHGEYCAHDQSRQVPLVVRFAICMVSLAICNRHLIGIGLALEADCGNVVVDCYYKKEMLWGRQLLLYPK